MNVTELMNVAEKGSATAEEFQNIVEAHLEAVKAACNVTETEEVTEGFCPRTFDGWSCWNETPAGATAYGPCPWFVEGFDPKLKAHKECLADGSWFRHWETNVTWSNYTTCVDLDAFSRYQTVTTIYQVGYLISLIALIVSLIIFCSFRSLHCTRVVIHKHLFVSFITNNILWLVWYRVILTESTPDNELNQTGCAILHILVMFFMLANYFWMFCEGFYLHTLLVYAFNRAEKRLLRGFYVFGWGGPVLPISLYGYLRATDDDWKEQKDCWINDSKYSLIISIPVCICLLLSLIFLINILRVLLIKLNATRISQRRESTVAESTASLRKAAKATMILVPLLGVHYLLIPFRPEAGSGWAVYYEYIAAISASFQGLAVSVFFCFFNGEVMGVLRRKFSGRGRGGADYSRTMTKKDNLILHSNI